MHNKSTFPAVGTAGCAVTARRAGGTYAVLRPTTLVAPLNAARTAQRAVPTLLVFLIQLYRWILSPAQVFLFGGGSGCRFSPTCSQYAAEAIRHHGAVAGGILAVKRICRCHPFGDCGLDPVPQGDHSGQCGKERRG